MHELKVLVFPEEDGWVAVCLDHFVAGQGRQADRAVDNLLKSLALHADDDKREGRELFSELPKAPNEFWEMLKAAEKTTSRKPIPVERSRGLLPPPWMIVALEQEARVR